MRLAALYYKFSHRALSVATRQPAAGHLKERAAPGGAVQFFVLAARSATCAKTPLSCLPSSWNQMQRSVPSLCTATTVILGPPEFS